jgi:hypothetical protein
MALVEWLVGACGADTNRASASGWRALGFAVLGGGHLDVIDFLLYETPADPTLLDNQ